MDYDNESQRDQKRASKKKMVFFNGHIFMFI
jgi:hypothetical protein